MHKLNEHLITLNIFTRTELARVFNSSCCMRLLIYYVNDFMINIVIECGYCNNTVQYWRPTEREIFLQSVYAVHHGYLAFSIFFSSSKS